MNVFVQERLAEVMFRKPKRNVRQRKVSSDGDSDDHSSQDKGDSLQELQSNINKFKERQKSSKKSAGRSGSSSGSKSKQALGKDDQDGKKLLSFQQDLNEGGETDFRAPNLFCDRDLLQTTVRFSK